MIQQRLAQYRNSSTSQTGTSATCLHPSGMSSVTQINAWSTPTEAQTSHTSSCFNNRHGRVSQSSMEVKDSTKYSNEFGTITWVAKNPEYASKDARLQSFSSWPCPDIQQPTDLVEAGFYFTGCDDRVRCFACNGGLCNWARQDVPWYEHYKWYRDCPYVKDCQQHPVVAAIIDTARTLDSASGCHHQHQGQTQCD